MRRRRGHRRLHQARREGVRVRGQPRRIHGVRHRRAGSRVEARIVTKPDRSLAQDYWLLWRGGYAALGVVGHTSVVGCVPDVQTQRAQHYRRLAGSGRVNRELEIFGRGIQSAVGRAVDGMRKAATALHATGIVGVRIDRTHMMVERENPSGGYARRPPGAPAHREDLVVTVHAIGTAIALAPTRSAESSRLQIQPVRNLGAKETHPREL